MSDFFAPNMVRFKRCDTSFIVQFPVYGFKPEKKNLPDLVLLKEETLFLAIVLKKSFLSMLKISIYTNIGQQAKSRKKTKSDLFPGKRIPVT